MKCLSNYAIILVVILIIGLSPNAYGQRVLVIGDSLTEGLGVAKNEAFPYLVQQQLRSELKNENIDIINAGVSGATTASGIRTLRFHLKKKPKVLLLALGANDGLRGFDPELTRKNLAATIDLALAKKMTVVLAGMKAPPNYGEAYAESFAKVYPELAKKKRILLIPFLLEGVAGEKEMNQPDGIHPSSKGHERIAKTIIKYIKPLL
jgi:acyl-CoA thioesterase-1